MLGRVLEYPFLGLIQVIMNSIQYSDYKSELQLPNIINLIENDLSEPYSVYTYRYFIHNWPNLCFLVFYSGKNQN